MVLDPSKCSPGVSPLAGPLPVCSPTLQTWHRELPQLWEEVDPPPDPGHQQHYRQVQQLNDLFNDLAIQIIELFKLLKPVKSIESVKLMINSVILGNLFSL